MGQICKADLSCATATIVAEHISFCSEMAGDAIKTTFAGDTAKSDTTADAPTSTQTPSCSAGVLLLRQQLGLSVSTHPVYL